MLEPAAVIASSTKIEEETLYLNTGSCNATGIVTAEGFVLFAGASISEKVSAKSLNKGAIKLRQKHIDAGHVKDGKTTEDIIFSSSSAAADFVVGYSISGPANWKNSAGESLKEIEAKDA